VDKNPALSCAIGNLKTDDLLSVKAVLRQVKFLNNIVEQDHRFIKKITKPALGFQSCRTASKTLCGIEAMHMIKKGQVKRASIADETRAHFINRLFGLAS
jgi:transposase-like protein